MNFRFQTSLQVCSRQSDQNPVSVLTFQNSFHREYFEIDYVPLPAISRKKIYASSQPLLTREADLYYLNPKVNLAF